MARNKNKLIKAAYAYSEKLGKEVEAVSKGKANPENLKKLRKLLKREFGKDAALVYETIVSVLDRSH